MLMLPALLLLFGMLSAAIAAGILGLGSLFAHAFAVTTFEAAIIVACAAFLVLLWIGWAGPALASTGQPEDEADAAQPVLVLDAIPVPRRRGAKQRKRP